LSIKTKLNEIKGIFFPLTSIRKKLILLIFSIIFPLMLMTGALLSYFFYQLRENIYEQVENERALVVRQYQKEQDKALAFAKLISQTPEVVTGTETGNVKIIQNSFTMLSKHLDASFMTIHDWKGRCLGKSHSPNDPHQNEKEIDYVKKGLEKQKPLKMNASTHEGMVILSSFPIYRENDQKEFIGIAAVGYILNQNFALRLKEKPESHVFFVFQDRIISSSIENYPDFYNIESILEENAQINHKTIDVEDKKYMLSKIPLIHDQDESLYILLAVDITKERRTILVTRWIVSLFFIISLFISVFFAGKMSKKITRPIYNLMETSKKISYGDYSVRSEVKSRDEIEVLGKTFNLMIGKIEEIIGSLDLKVEERTQQLHLTLEEKKVLLNKIDQEFQIAKKIQQNLIPKKCPDVDSMKIAAFYKPMEELGGDFYDFVLLEENRKIGIFISDVSGHGAPAALITSMIKTLIETAGENRLSPSLLLSYVNDKISGQTNGHFLTAFYGLYDTETKKMTYARGAHNFPYLIRNNEVIEVRSKGKIIGVIDGEVFEEREIELKKGDKILFYTDGLTEAQNHVNEDFENHLEKFMLDYAHLPIDDFLNNIYYQLVLFKGNEKFLDDVCIVGIEILL